MRMRDDKRCWKPCAAAQGHLQQAIEQRIEKQDRDRYTAETVICIRGQLTEKQFRRLWLRYVDGLDVEDIARHENKVHSSVSKSISATGKIFLSFF